jgi:hypothetical protein
MFLSKLIKENSIGSLIENVELSVDLLENTLNENIEFMELEQSEEPENFEVYKYVTEDNEDIEMFEYIVGIKITATNLSYHVTHMNGEIITSSTKSQILPESERLTFKRSPSAVRTSLNYLLQALINGSYNEMASTSSIVLHLHDFRQPQIKQVYKTLSQHFNIKSIVTTSTNPHNGCRPSKIKTKHTLRFHHSLPK